MRSLISKIEGGMANGAPRLHPNGFYTLDLSPREKLHVWPDREVRVRTDGGFIHDHTFAFRSVVLVGSITDTAFDIRPSTEGYALYHFPQPHGRTHLTRAKPSRDAVRFAPMPSVTQRIQAGSAYDVETGTFHRSDPIGFTATWLTITDFGDPKSRARVLIPPGNELERFDRTLAPGESAGAGFDIGRVVNLLLKQQA